MLKQSIFWMSVLLLFACKRQEKKEFEPKEIDLHIICENEKYLLENVNSDLEYSFDTIFSTKSYWKHINHEQAILTGHKHYPYTTITADSPSLYNHIEISLVGYGEWKNDSRLKTVVDNTGIDSNRVADFFERISNNSDTTETRNKAELFLSFYKDSIVNISKSLKEIARIYIRVQEKNSQRLFSKELCSLTISQLDSIKKNIPFRIRLMRQL